MENHHATLSIQGFPAWNMAVKIGVALGHGWTNAKSIIRPEDDALESIVRTIHGLEDAYASEAAEQGMRLPGYRAPGKDFLLAGEKLVYSTPSRGQFTISLASMLYPRIEVKGGKPPFPYMKEHLEVKIRSFKYGSATVLADLHGNIHEVVWLGDRREISELPIAIIHRGAGIKLHRILKGWPAPSETAPAELTLEEVLGFLPEDKYYVDTEEVRRLIRHHLALRYAPEAEEIFRLAMYGDDRLVVTSDMADDDQPQILGELELEMLKKYSLED